MIRVINSTYQDYQDELDEIIAHFDRSGEEFGDQDRNTLKLFELDGHTINIKSFKVPNLINQIAYRFFRKSKARRSFEHAKKLTQLKIGTPNPVAFYEFPSLVLFGRSFYISEHLDVLLTYRELTFDQDMDDHEEILRAFTRFTFDLHEKGVNFLDHSPGNTLIKKSSEGYEFYLVDLNRMRFQPLDFKTRIKNFRKLTIHQNMIMVMSDEYAKCSGYDYDRIFDLMWSSTEKFQQKFHRKRRLKKRLKFWK